MNDQTSELKSTEVDLRARRRSRISLLALVAIALLPVLGAYVLYFFVPGFVPGSFSNNGTFIEPPVQLQAVSSELAANEGKWTLLLPLEDTRCDVSCEEMLYVARQVNVALGKDSERVQRALLQQPVSLSGDTDALLRIEYPKMRRFQLDSAAFEKLSEIADNQDIAGRIYLADPNGNIMMFFEPGQAGGDILDDLKHMLRLSNIG